MEVVLCTVVVVGLGFIVVVVLEELDVELVLRIVVVEVVLCIVVVLVDVLVVKQSLLQLNIYQLFCLQLFMVVVGFVVMDVELEVVVDVVVEVILVEDEEITKLAVTLTLFPAERVRIPTNMIALISSIFLGIVSYLFIFFV